MRPTSKKLPRLIAAAVLLLTVVCSACGPRQPGELEGPVDFAFTMEQRPGRLSQFRGGNTLVVLMRTSELVSQIYMSRLREAYDELSGVCTLLVLTVEPTEAPFVESYREIENLPFPVGVAEEYLVVGKSRLGVIPNIPHTYFIGPDGSVLFHISGVLETEDIRVGAQRFFDR